MRFEKLSAEQRKSLEAATAKYQASITPEAAQYLLGRGIGKDVALTFRLGFVVEPEPGHERFVGMVSIPYLTRAGVVGIRFRRIDDGRPKYNQPAGAGTHIYNASALLENSPHIVLCEGEIDTITMAALVGIPAVGVPGVGNWKRHYRRLFANHERVFICLDNDEREDKDTNPGLAAAQKLAKELPHGVIVHLPPGRDVNDLYLNEGPDGIRKRLGL